MRGVSRDIVEEILKKAKEGENILPEEDYSPISPIYSPIEDSLNFSFSDIINPETSEESLTSLDFIPAPPASPQEDNKLSSKLSLVPEAGWLYTPEELAQDILAPELSTAFQDKDTQFGLELIKHFPTEEALREDLAKATGLSDEEKQRVLDIYRNTKANLPYIQATTQQSELEPISITSPAQEPTLPQLPQEDYTGELPDFATALEEVKPPEPKLDFTPEEVENVRKHLNFTTALLNHFPDEESLQEDLKKSSLDEKAQEQVLQLYRSVKEAEPYYRYFSLLPEDIRPKFYLAFQHAVQNNDNPMPFYKKILEEAGYTNKEKLKKLPPLQRTLIEGILNQPDWKITKKDMEDFTLNYGLEVLSGALAPISAPLAIGATLGTGLLATKAITDAQKVVDSYALKLIEKYKDNPEIIAKMKEGILPEDIEVPEEYKGQVDVFTSSIDREAIFKQEVAEAVKDFLNGDILQKPITGYELSSFTGDISGVLTRLLFQGPTGAARKLAWVGAEQLINVCSGEGSIKASQYAVEKWGKLAGVPAATLGALVGGTVAHAISAVPRAVVSVKIASSAETPEPSLALPLQQLTDLGKRIEWATTGTIVSQDAFRYAFEKVRKTEALDVSQSPLVQNLLKGLPANEVPYVEDLVQHLTQEQKDKNQLFWYLMQWGRLVKHNAPVLSERLKRYIAGEDWGLFISDLLDQPVPILRVGNVEFSYKYPKESSVDVFQKQLTRDNIDLLYDFARFVNEKFPQKSLRIIFDFDKVFSSSFGKDIIVGRCPEGFEEKVEKDPSSLLPYWDLGKTLQVLKTLKKQTNKSYGELLYLQDLLHEVAHSVGVKSEVDADKISWGWVRDLLSQKLKKPIKFGNDLEKEIQQAQSKWKSSWVRRYSTFASVEKRIAEVPRVIVVLKQLGGIETPSSIKDMADIKKADLVSDSMLADATQQEAQKTALTVPEEAKANLPDAVASKLQLKAHAEGKQQDELWDRVLPEVPDSFYVAQTVAKDLKEKGELERLPLLTKGLMRLALYDEVLDAIDEVVKEASAAPEKFADFGRSFIKALEKKGVQPPVSLLHEAMQIAAGIAHRIDETTVLEEVPASKEVLRRVSRVFKKKPQEFLQRFSQVIRELLPAQNEDFYERALKEYKEISAGKYEPIDDENLTQEFFRRNGAWVYRDLSEVLSQRRTSLTAGGTAESALSHLFQRVKEEAPNVFKQLSDYFSKLRLLGAVVFSDEGRQAIRDALMFRKHMASRMFSSQDVEPIHRRQHLTLLSQLGIPDKDLTTPDPIGVYYEVRRLLKKEEGNLDDLIRGVDGLYDLLTLVGNVRRLSKDFGEGKARALFITSAYQVLSRNEELLSVLEGHSQPSLEVLSSYFYPSDVPFWVQLKTNIKALQTLIDQFNPIYKAEKKHYFEKEFKEQFLPQMEQGFRKIQELLNGDKVGVFSPFKDEVERIVNYVAKLRSLLAELTPDQLKRRIQSLADLISSLDAAVRSYTGGSLTPYEIASRLSYALGSTKLATLTRFGRGIERVIPESVRKFFTYYFVSPLSDLPRAVAHLFDINETARREMQRAIEQVYPYVNATVEQVSRKATRLFTKDVLDQEDISLLKDILSAGLVVKQGRLHPRKEKIIETELEVFKDIRRRLKQSNLTEKQIIDLLHSTNAEFYVNSKLKHDRDLPLMARIVNTNLMHRWLFRALEDNTSLAYRSLDSAGKQFVQALRRVLNHSYDLLASRGLLPFSVERYKDKYVHYLYYLLNENVLHNLDTPIFKEVNAQNALIYLLKHIDYQTKFIEKFKELYERYREELEKLPALEGLGAKKIRDILTNIVEDEKMLPSTASISKALKYGKEFKSALAYEMTKRAIQRTEGLPYKPQLLILIEKLLKKSLTQFEEDEELKALYPYPDELKKADKFYTHFLLQPKLPDRNIDEVLHKGITMLVQHFQRPDITPLVAIKILRKILPPELTGDKSAGILIPRQYLDLSLKNFLLMNYNPIDAVIKGINATLNLVHHYDILNKLVAEFKLILPEKEAMKYGDMYVPISAELLAKKYPAVAQRAIKALLPPEGKYYIHKALLEALDEAEALNRFKKNLWTYIRQFLRSLSVPYKIAMAVWNPMVIGANFLGNFIPVVLASRSFSKGIEYYIRGIKGMIAKDADYQELASLGLIRSMAGVFQELVGTRLRPEASYEKFSKFMLNLLDLWSKGKLLGILSKANAFFDDAARLGVYKYLKENGYEIPISELALAGVPKTELLFKALSGKLPRRKLTQEQIVELVKHYSFDYFDIPEGVRAIRDTLMPFASFPYLTLRMYAKTLSENPIAGIRLLFTPALANLSAEVFFNVDPNLDRIVPGSDYLTGSTNILTLFTAPVATVRTLVSHPVIATLWGLLTGRDVYSLREIYDVPSSIWGEQYERFVSIANMLKYIANKAIQNYIPDVWQMLGWQAYYSLHNSDVDLLTTLLEPPWIYKYLTGATSASSHIPKFLRWLYLAGVRVEPINYAKLKLDLIKNIDLSLIRLKSYGRILTRGGSIWRVLGRTPQEIYASYYRTLQHYKDEYRKLQELLQYANTDLLLYRNRLNPIDRWLTRALLQVRSNLESLVKSMKKR